MSRILDARLSKIERELGAGNGDEVSYEDLLGAIRAKLLAMLDSPDTQPAEREFARDNLARLDAKVWARRYGEQPLLSIIDALSDGSGRVFCRIVDPEKGDARTPDWYALARKWGIVDVSDGGMRPGAVRLLERVIVTTTHAHPSPEVAH